MQATFFQPFILTILRSKNMICMDYKMIKSDVTEIKKQFSHENCSITKICGCYVDGDKEIKTKLSEAFLCLPEEETFKYFEIFKKTLSGTLGKNLLNLDFPISAEFHDGTQAFLLKLRDSELKDEALVDEFYSKIIQMYDFVGNYLILLVYAAYDIPGKGSDKLSVDDASDEVYSYILCSICPVNLSKPGLSYNDESNVFQERLRDWVVAPPSNGFLFPAFNDRSTDIHQVLYYSKNSEELHYDFVDEIFGCTVPLSAGGQKETFQTLIEETLGDDCDYEIVKTIHEKVTEKLEEHKDIPEPLVLDKADVKSIFQESGVSDEKLKDFNRNFEEVAGEKTSLLAENIVNTKVFEVKTPDIVIKVNSDRTNLVETKMVDGRKCLVIEITDQVVVNGISLKTV